MTITEQRPTPGSDARGAVAHHWTGADALSPWITRARELGPALAAEAGRHDRTGEFVHEQFQWSREKGLLSMLVPVELGGGGATHAEACAVLAELAHGCPSTSLALSMHTHLVAAQVWRHHRGLPAPALRRVVDAGAVLVSTGAKDWIDSGGTATRLEGGYRVTARKAPSSACPAGDVLVTSFRWDDAPDGPQVVHASIPFTAEGVRIDETWDTMGMRGTGSHTVVLDDVFVPDDAVALLRPAGRWHPVWSVVLGAAMPLIMSTYVGVAESAADRALALAAGRSERPDVAPLAGRMLTSLTRARDTVRAMVDASDDLRFDNTVEAAATSLARKSNAAAAAIDTVEIALELGGGMAFARSGGIEMLLRDVHGATYHPLPPAQQQLLTGRVALGLDPLGSGR